MLALGTPPSRIMNAAAASEPIPPPIANTLVSLFALAIMRTFHRRAARREARA